MTSFWNLATLVAFAGLASSASYGSSFGFEEGRLDSFLEGSYFSSNKNIDETGSVVNLLSTNQFNEMRAELRASYDFTDSFSVFADLTFKRTNSTTLGLDRINWNFGDQTIGADALIYSGVVNVIPEISVTIPAYVAPGTDNAVLVGNGAIAATGRLYVTKSIGKFLLVPSAGFRYRTQGFSSQMPWEALGHLDVGRNFFAEAWVNGALTVLDDQYVLTPTTRKQVTDLYDGGSYMYDAVNPSWVSAGGRIGYRISSDLFVSVAGEQVLTGLRVAYGTKIFVGIGFSEIMGAPDGSTHYRSSKIQNTRRGEEKIDSGKFQEDTTSEDSALQDDEMTLKRVKVKDGKKYVKPVR